LSDALDLVGVNDFQHGKRVAMIARETGLINMGLPERRLDRLVCGCLLHDLGVSSTAVQRRLLQARPTGKTGTEHCETRVSAVAALSVICRWFPERGPLSPYALGRTCLADLERGTDALDSNLILLG
jgi:hypothetical protein